MSDKTGGPAFPLEYSTFEYGRGNFDGMASRAYEIADAMLKERAK